MTGLPSRIATILAVSLVTGCGTVARPLMPSALPATTAQAVTTVGNGTRATAPADVQQILTDAVRVHFPATTLAGAPTIQAIQLRDPATADTVRVTVTLRRFLKGFVQDWVTIEAGATVSRRTGAVRWDTPAKS